MAGIAGILGASPNQVTVEQMLETVEHRGPDAVRLHRTEQFRGGVCTSRLSAARGDGFARDGRVVMLFDGEIYNDRPAGTSDAEVALSLYRKHGRLFPGYLQGVFACAVADGDELVLARDGVGVRPLYWGVADGIVCFASELKALVPVVQEAQELPPATTFSTTCGISGYLPRWPELTMPHDAEAAAREVRRCLTEAVRRRLDDGAVGACLLSGGLDSSVIACVAHEIKPGLPTITVGIEGAPDLDNARLVAEHIGCEHHVHLYTRDDMIAMVPRAVRTLESFDEDCVSGTIANLFASGKAREFTNCILSGEGGDELFGGYHLLKDVPTEAGRLGMMKRLIDVAYNTALQRLDRAMMGSGINYRTPFIDTEVIALALQLPVRWKIHPAGDGRWIEKWVLREAFRDLLPDAIYRREKLRFSAGTGTDGLTDAVAAAHLPDAEFTEEVRVTEAGYRLSSPKELWYYRLFKQQFPAAAFERLVGRWDPGK